MWYISCRIPVGRKLSEHATQGEWLSLVNQDGDSRVHAEALTDIILDKLSGIQ